jgi:Pyridoxamine 5'-phosphate oxidase
VRPSRVGGAASGRRDAFRQAGGGMATVYSELDERLIAFIAEQPMFFVATAPCLDTGGSGGHVNVSPKGYRDTFAVLGPRTVAYLDLTGSGAETIAHLRQNGRITIMFCSFDRQPKILRLYGTGRAVQPGQPDWVEYAARFPAGEGDDASTGIARGNQRAIIVVSIDRISDSCGYAVPRMELTEERDLLTRWSERRSADDLVAYRVKHNSESIDGLPALS